MATPEIAPAEKNERLSHLVVVALGSGLVSGVVLTLLQGLVRGRERASDLRARRREDAARVVGPALASLRDLEPNSNVGALRGNVRADEALEQKWDAWLTAAGGIEVLGAMHPDTDVAKLSESVIDNGTKLMSQLHWAIREGDAQSEEWWAEVKAFHAAAIRDARKLVIAVIEQPA